MNAALVPVRGLAGAKKRLASCLTIDQREGLALAMLTDMIEALRAAAGVDRIVVVSADAELLRHAGEAGAEVLAEGERRGLNAAVAAAATRLEAEGVHRLLTIPGDVPLIEPLEVDALFREHAPHAPVVLVPSAAGTGTNGLLTSPPTVVEPHFEGASLQAHLAACHERALQARVAECPSFRLDIDTAEDLAQLAASANRTRRSALLARRALGDSVAAATLTIVER
jgi:2-phospho-L-lactate guanylyltransferase